jgi:hypothetical protein
MPIPAAERDNRPMLFESYYEAAGSSPVAHFSCLPSSLAIGARGHRLFIRNKETADTSIMRLFVLWLIDGSR